MASPEVLTTIAAQQSADLQRVAKQIGADIIPYIKRIESGIFEILAKYEDKNITRARQERIQQDINELSNLEYSAYLKDYNQSMKLASAEEVAMGVTALDVAIESDVDIDKPTKTAVNQAVIATPIQQGEKSWTTYKGMQTSFRSQYVDEINSAMLAAFQAGNTGKEVADAAYTQIHYQGRKASKSVLDRSRRGADSLAATGVNHVSNVTKVEFGEANKKLVKGYVFISVIDSSTSTTCREGDQTTMKADNPKFGAWSPPRHRGCRSSLGYDVDARYKLDEDETTRASSFRKDGLQNPKRVPSKEAYYQQMIDADMSADDMNQILGVSLGKAFRKGIKDGTLTPDSFAKMTVDSLFQPLTIQQMSERNNRLGEILRKQKG